MTEAVVWIAQEPMRKDASGNWVSKGLDIASASKYGKIVIAWPPDAFFLSRSLIQNQALDIAERYNDKLDYVVALGSPTLLSILAWSIGTKHKTLRMLEWDNRMQQYYPTLGDTLASVLQETK